MLSDTNDIQEKQETSANWIATNAEYMQHAKEEVKIKLEITLEALKIWNIERVKSGLNSSTNAWRKKVTDFKTRLSKKEVERITKSYTSEGLIRLVRKRVRRGAWLTGQLTRFNVRTDCHWGAF